MKRLETKGLQEPSQFPLVDKGARNFSKGSVLIIVIWSLYLLTIFAVHLGFGAKQKILIVNNLGMRAKLHFIAQAGIKRAILELKKIDSTVGFDALKELWSTNVDIFNEIKVGEGSYTVSYNFFNKKNGGYLTRHGIIDEERKINVNKVKRKVVERLFKVIGFDSAEAQNLSAAIIDWRDGDSQLSIPLGSGEDRYYKNLSDPYEAKDYDFEVLEELLLVKGIDREVFDKIKDFVTIYGNGKININTASAEVLLALGLHKNIVDKILLFRYGEDLIEATPDDNIFDSPSKILASLSQYSSLTDSEAAGLNNLISMKSIGTESSNFMIKSRAKIDSYNLISEIVCVFQRPLISQSQTEPDEKGKIKYWREDLY